MANVTNSHWCCSCLFKRARTTCLRVDCLLLPLFRGRNARHHVTRLWPHCPPKDIKALGFDLGQAFVVGISALLPDQGISDRKGKTKCPSSTSSTLSSAPPPPLRDILPLIDRCGFGDLLGSIGPSYWPLSLRNLSQPCC